MWRTHQACRAVALALGTAVLLAGSLPATSVAVVSITTFHLRATVGDGFIYGTDADPDEAVRITQKRHGARIDTSTVIANGSGVFELTTKPLLTGDQLVVHQGGGIRTLTVPRLTVEVNAATDVVTGQVPAVQPYVTLHVYYQAGPTNVATVDASFNVSRDGTFSQDFTADRDIQGGDVVALEWPNAFGDRWTRLTVAPAVTVRAGSPQLDATGRPGTTETIELETAHGALLATARQTFPLTADRVHGTFRHNGHSVAARVGDLVIQPQRPTDALRIQAPNLAVDGPAGGTLDAACYPYGDWSAWMVGIGSSLTYLADGVAGTSGTIHVPNLDGTGTTIPSGTKIRLYCETLAGDSQEMNATVP